MNTREIDLELAVLRTLPGTPERLRAEVALAHFRERPVQPRRASRAVVRENTAAYRSSSVREQFAR